ECLVEYNFNRPHQYLVYLTPVEYIEKELAKTHSSVLPMWSASTPPCKYGRNDVPLHSTIECPIYV
ncbi:MAG: hypothetical protein J7L19_04220, partial [Dehalococcoidia bacterium]|nr:hypothetical protein [Dehalococcoidia bacterium]